MGGSALGIAIEALVAVLLAVTIGYCVLVNHKLVQLRSDQSELKAIVRDLHAATAQAEHAIAGLRESAQTADDSLGHQLDRVRNLDQQLRANIGKGEALLAKLAVIPRGAQAAAPPQAGSRPHGKTVRQSGIGLGLLNAQRRNAAAGAGGLDDDEVAA